jgi:protein phosphatase 2C
VAKFCAERMHEMIAKEWDKEAVDGYDWRRRWESTFSRGFERADNEGVTEAATPEMVGSTAVVVVLSGCQIITSNCGDSRAILCRGTQTIPLTVDQKVKFKTLLFFFVLHKIETECHFYFLAPSNLFEVPCTKSFT